MTEVVRRHDGVFDIGLGPMKADEYIMETGRVDLAVYASHDRFETEREIFGRVWLNIAEAGEIANPGDWIVRDVAIRSASILIVRGKDGTIRAFHNICSHRGMKLAWNDKGRGGKFSCPYHAWTYDATGSLVNVPDEGCFPHLDKKESGLTPVRCDTWQGMVFINLDASGTQSLAEYLGPLADRLHGLPFASYPVRGRMSGVVEANWKLVSEAQHEAYHVRALHARTVGQIMSSKDNPFVHAIRSELLGAHRTSSVPSNPDYELSEDKPVQYFAFRHAAQMIVADSGTQDHPADTFAEHPGVNPSGSNLWSNDQFSLFPNFILHVGMNGWWFHRFWPISRDRCSWESVFFFERPQSFRAAFALEYSLSFNRDTLTEDNVALEKQQRLIDSGGKATVQFGQQEMMCMHMAAVTEAASVARPSRPGKTTGLRGESEQANALHA